MSHQHQTHEADSLTGLKSRRIHLKQEKQFSWFPTLPEESIGPFDDLDEDSKMVLSIDRFCFRGMKATFINVLQKDYKFRITHAFDLGKKEGQLPTGKKDGQRSAYTFGSLLSYNEWVCQINRVQGKQTQLHLEWNGDKLHAALQGQVNATQGMSQWELDLNYKILDMCLETKLSTSPSVGFAYTQPISPKFGVGTMINFFPFADKAQIKLMAKHKDSSLKSQMTAALTTGMGADELQLVYIQEILPNLSFITASDLSLAKKSPMSAEKDWVSVIKAGYTFDSKQTGQSVQGLFDSAGNVMCLASAAIGPDISLLLAANMNYSKNIYDFGVGIQLPI
jgi:hypothetical protein